MRRLVAGGADIGLRGMQRFGAVPVIAGLRLFDVRGSLAALRGRPVPGV